MASRMVEYNVPLRKSTITARLVLPADLRQDEADELAELLQALVMPSQDTPDAPEYGMEESGE